MRGYSTRPHTAGSERALASTPDSRPAPLGWLLLCTGVALVAAAGLSALWTIFALATASLAGWMACVAGIDAALLLRLSGRPSDRARARASILVYLFSVAASVYVVGAARLGSGLGLQPLEALERISPGLVQLYLLSNDTPWDWFWLGIGAVLYLRHWRPVAAPVTLAALAVLTSAAFAVPSLLAVFGP